MTRLLVHVEGENEEDFVNYVLTPHLQGFGYSLVGARLLGNARQRNRRGGITPWPAARKDILNHLRGDPGGVATTMVDYCGLPQSGLEGWPGRAEASGPTSPDKPRSVDDALLTDISQELGCGFNHRRFIPYVMMHEFEAMLFSDCEGLPHAIHITTANVTDRAGALATFDQRRDVRRHI